MVDLVQVTGRKMPEQQYQPDNRFVLPTCNIGLELEVEHVPRGMIENYPDLARHWNVVAEGSLRNDGKEFVLSHPLFGRDLHEAIESLDTVITDQKKKNKNRFTSSERTSFHVHIDIRDLRTTKDLFSFLAIYLMMERSLFRYFGDVREDNIFCLPLYRTPFPIRVYKALLGENPEQINHELRGGMGHYGLYKYSAFNAVPMFDFGSVEFRHAPAMWDTEQVVEWVNIIMSMKKAATEYNYLDDDVAHQVSSQGHEQIMYDIFGPELADKLITPETVRDIYQGIRVTQRIQNELHHQKMADSFKSMKRRVAPRHRKELINSLYQSFQGA